VRDVLATCREKGMNGNKTGGRMEETYQILRNCSLHRLLRQAKDGDELAHTVGAIVAEEEGVAV
jgi:hypothetical protein